MLEGLKVKVFVDDNSRTISLSASHELELSHLWSRVNLVLTMPSPPLWLPKGRVITPFKLSNFYNIGRNWLALAAAVHVIVNRLTNL